MLRLKHPTIQAVFVAIPENEPHTRDVGVFLPMPLDPPALVEAVWRTLAENE
jgi:hypothetical protein